MLDLINAIDYLKSLIDTETALRQAANVEWSTGNHNGPMKIAHDAILLQIVEASKGLIAVGDK